jgi:hypothetical protein
VKLLDSYASLVSNYRTEMARVKKVVILKSLDEFMLYNDWVSYVCLCGY